MSWSAALPKSRAALKGAGMPFMCVSAREEGHPMQHAPASFFQEVRPSSKLVRTSLVDPTAHSSALIIPELVD
jgi:hypothetical protein